MFNALDPCPSLIFQKENTILVVVCAYLLGNVDSLQNLTNSIMLGISAVAGGVGGPPVAGVRGSPVAGGVGGPPVAGVGGWQY